MATTFPASKHDLVNPSPGTPTTDTTIPHSGLHTNTNDLVEAVQDKLGYGSSGQAAAADTVLRGVGAKLTDFGKVFNAHVDAAAAIAYSKLSLVGSIVNSDISNTAAIDGAKIAANSMPGDRIGDESLTSAKIANGTIQGADIANGAVGTSQIGAGQVTTGHILDRTILAGDIAVGTITPTELAANAATYPIYTPSSTAFSGTSGGWTLDISGAASGWWGPLAAGSKVFVQVAGHFHSGTAGAVGRVGIARYNSVGTIAILAYVNINFRGLNIVDPVSIQVMDTPPADSYIYCICAMSVTPGADCSWYPDGSRTFFLVELRR